MVGKATTTVFRPRASGAADPTEPGKGAKSLSCVRSVVFPLIALPRHSSKNSTASTVSSSSCSPLETTLSSESFYSCEEGEGALHEVPTSEGEAAGSLSAAEHHEEVDRIDRKNHEEVDRIDPKSPHKSSDDTNLRFAEEIRLFKKERELNSAELEKRRAELKILRCRLGEKTAANAATRPSSPSAKMCKRLRRNHHQQQQQQPSDERSVAFLEYQIGMAQIEMLRLQRQEIFLVQQERELRREARRLMRVQQQRSNDVA